MNNFHSVLLAYVIALLPAIYFMLKHLGLFSNNIIEKNATANINQVTTKQHKILRLLERYFQMSYLKISKK
jgi:hypothetical protein